MSDMVEIDIDFDYCGEVEMILAHDECGEHDDVEFYRNDLLTAENAKLRKLAEKYVRQAYALACEKGNPITRDIIVEDARELGIEVGE